VLKAIVRNDMYIYHHLPSFTIVWVLRPWDPYPKNTQKRGYQMISNMWVPWHRRGSFDIDAVNVDAKPRGLFETSFGAGWRGVLGCQFASLVSALISSNWVFFFAFLVFAANFQQNIYI